jgi:D-inositol-3-phosphate glycosyltransferase
MARDISVAVIEPVGGHGGADYYDFSLCRALLGVGCRVSFYTCDETIPLDIPGLRFFPIFRRVYGSGSRWKRAARYILGIVATLARTVVSGEKICHLHVYGGETRELALILMSRIVARKVVITVHDVESFQTATGRRRAIIGKFYRLADWLIVHNEITRADLVERVGVPSAKISVIAHGNHIESVVGMADSATAKHSFGIEESKKVVLFIGHIKQVKGLDLLIQAIPEVAREVPEAVFLIAGRPWRSDFSQYQNLIDELGISDLCMLHIGFIPNEDLERYYAAADIVVLPYRRIYQSGVVIMAMSSERCVVVSDLPGMTEIVTDGQNGYVFSRGSKDALAKQLIQVLKNDLGRKHAAEMALEYMQQHHDWEQIGKSTAEIYQSILSAR